MPSGSTSLSSELSSTTESSTSTSSSSSSATTSNINDRVIDVYRVEGLGLSQSMSNNYLTVVFCKTRAMCVEFYSWYWKERIIPFVNRVRSDDKRYDPFLPIP